MPNAKMDKINTEIVRVTSKIYEHTAKAKELNEKLTELEKQKIEIENAEIIALYRREKLNEDQFAALLQETKKATSKNGAAGKNQTVDESEDETDDSSDGDSSIPIDDNTVMESDI